MLSLSFLFLCPFVYLKIGLFRILLTLFIIPHLLLHVAWLWSLPLSWFLGNGSRSVRVKYHRIYDHVGGDLSLTLSILSWLLCLCSRSFLLSLSMYPCLPSTRPPSLKVLGCLRSLTVLSYRLVGLRSSRDPPNTAFELSLWRQQARVSEPKTEILWRPGRQPNLSISLDTCCYAMESICWNPRRVPAP